MDLFQENLNALKRTNLPLAQNLEQLVGVENFEIFMNEGDLLSLNFVHKKNFIPLYENNPKTHTKEILTVFENCKLYPFLYIYGVANGAVVSHLLENETLQRVVVIEPEIELLYAVLHFYDFRDALSSGRLQLFYASKFDYAQARSLFATKNEQRYAKTYDLMSSSNYYEKHFESNMIVVNRLLIEGVYYAINEVGNDTKDALIGLKHHILNLPKLFKTPTFIELIHSLNNGNPAILVSTGPSLNKQLPLLKEIAPYVRIIAVDASFPILSKEGIRPDVVVSMERVVQTARFFTETPKEAFDGVVFALSSLQHKEVIESIKGGTLQMSLRPLGYMIESGPKAWGFVGIGTSAANMGFELIHYSGFKKVIIIGQDLAYDENGSSHAFGHVFGENNVKEEDNNVWVEGWGGLKKVKTNHNWVMFRKFFEKDIRDIGDNMLTINATEGGAHIEGAEEISFKNAVFLHVKRSKKESISLKYPQEKELKGAICQTEEKLDEIVLYVKNLLEDVKKLFLELAELEESDSKDFSLIESTLDKVAEMLRRTCDEIYANVVWHIAQSMLLVQELDLAPPEVYLPKNEKEKQERLGLLASGYKTWLFSFSGILDAIIKTITYARARTLMESVEHINVEVDGEVIDSFTCKALKSTFGRVFDVDMRGILYDMPDIHVGKAAVFKDAKTGETLPEAFVSVITREDEKYNELSFMKSLEEPIDKEKIKDLYCPNAIGFLATEENLADEEFVGYIKELMERFPDVEFKGFCFSKTDIIVLEKTFSARIKAKIINNFLNITNEVCLFIQTQKIPVLPSVFQKFNLFNVWFVGSAYRSCLAVKDYDSILDSYHFKNFIYNQSDIISDNYAEIFANKLNCNNKDKLLSEILYYERIKVFFGSKKLRKFLLKQ